MFPKRGKIASEDREISSAISKNDYQVFLSFRGPDTRQGLADCLYHALIDAGIRVFRDDDELALGDKIDEILTALDNSKICIVLLSLTFAESSWCLREVVRMVDMKKRIVPIFYYVTPDDVKLKTHLYANALTMHETKYGKEKLQQWREALKEIPTNKVRALKSSGFVEFSRQIAKEILTKLKVKHKYEIENFVQVEDEVEDALNLLDVGSGGRRFLGIHGMGGIGKTTLAKIVFNQISDSFDCSCFLENIREQSGGLQKLQEQLLRSLDPSLQDATQIFDAMGKIKNNFTRKKVIIVLDDIDHKNHIRDLVGSFGIGSRLIFTTRMTRLHEQTTSSNADFYGLEKKAMDSKQALKLFSKHAFGEDSPPKDFKDHSIEAISTMGGLPLALEVVGSFLYRQKAKVWIDTIKKLKEAPYQDVQHKLKISYDALDAKQQAIFLDIACFFIGKEKTNAIYMWEACDFYPNEGIGVLISMSLIKLNEKKCFWMHDQLRDLGRAIVNVNSKDDRASSRLWVNKDSLDLLEINEGTEKVEALHLDGPSCYLDRGNFVGLDKLRFLRLKKGSDFGGDFGGLFPKLRWLSLSFLVASSFNVTNLCLRELVILELSSIRFDETWQGWGQILISKQLKVLTLSNCHKLVSTPDLSKVVNLERLVLKGCDKLTYFHTSVGKLQCLRRLRITKCESFHGLLESIGRLVSLTRLELRGSCIVNLPNSIGELAKLKHLSLREHHDLRVLPDSIGDLRSLISLDLSGTGITELPITIGRLAKLKTLCLVYCIGLQRLPDSIGDLQSLIVLNMSGTRTVELPHSFINLADLQMLDLTGSITTYLPVSFRGLEKLEILTIGDTARYWIRELHELPIGLTSLTVFRVQKIQNLSSLIHLSQLLILNYKEWEQEGGPEWLVLEGIEKLIKLEELYIECSSVKSLSTEWGALQQLKTLKLCCPSLEFGKCQLPSSLESLHLEVKEWGQLPINLSSVKNLSKLELCNFVIEEADLAKGLECLEDLEMSNCILKLKDFPVLKRLRDLTLDRCRVEASPCPVDDDDYDMAEGCVIGSEFQIKLCNLNNLSELKLRDDGLDGLASSGLVYSELPKNLTRLELLDYYIHDDDDGLRFEGLESLVELIMNDCTIFEFRNVSILTSLTSLHIVSCSFPMITCLHMPKLDCLVKLEIYSCQDIVDIQGIEKLKSLTELSICDCDSLRRIEELSELNGLARITIRSCPEFEGIDGGFDRLLSTGTLSELDIKECKCNNLWLSEDVGVDDSEDDSDDIKLFSLQNLQVQVPKKNIRLYVLFFCLFLCVLDIEALFLFYQLIRSLFRFCFEI